METNHIPTLAMHVHRENPAWACVYTNGDEHIACINSLHVEAFVRAVNCHEELLAAAKYFRSLVDADLLDAMTRNGNPHDQAIAKAEGK